LVKSNVNAVIRSDRCDVFGGESEPQRCEGLLSIVLMTECGGEMVLWSVCGTVR